MQSLRPRWWAPVQGAAFSTLSHGGHLEGGSQPITPPSHCLSVVSVSPREVSTNSGHPQRASTMELHAGEPHRMGTGTPRLSAPHLASFGCETHHGLQACGLPSPLLAALQDPPQANLGSSPGLGRGTRRSWWGDERVLVPPRVIVSHPRGHPRVSVSRPRGHSGPSLSEPPSSVAPDRSRSRRELRRSPSQSSWETVLCLSEPPFPLWAPRGSGTLPPPGSLPRLPSPASALSSTGGDPHECWGWGLSGT